MRLSRSHIFSPCPSTSRILLIAGVVAFATCAVAPDPAHAGAPRTHDGFFLRLSGGIGSGGTEIEDDSAELEMNGLSGDANFAVGGIISPNLALHGTFWGWTVNDPDVEFLGFDGEADGVMSMNAVGPGVTYYFMPVNMYLSGSAGLAWMSFEEDDLEDSDFDTDPGFALDATLGKEWWVGNSWGLGIAGDIGFHSIPSDVIDDNFSGLTFGLRFSATLN